MTEVGSLAAGSVLEGHPGLRCALLKGLRGWLPWFIWRLGTTRAKFGPGSEIQISQPASQYFFRRCSIPSDADANRFVKVVEVIGDDNIAVWTKYPHLERLFSLAVEEIARLDGVRGKTKGTILWGHCANSSTLLSSV